MSFSLKEAQRLDALERRRSWVAAYPSLAEEACLNICHKLACETSSFSGQILAGYWPLPGEVDIRPFMTHAAHKGRVCALPRVISEDTMIFAAWGEGEPLEQNYGKALAPLKGRVALDPQVVLTPMLAFTRKGIRLGYGKGYYDRALAALRKKQSVYVIGVAFSVQEVEDLCAEPHDQGLDLIVTEKEIFRCA